MINSLIVATGLLGLVLLYLLAQASGSTSLLSDHYWLLLGLNALLGLGLALFLGRELLRMRRAVRQRVFGAKLTLRMTTPMPIMTMRLRQVTTITAASIPTPGTIRPMCWSMSTT